MHRVVFQHGADIGQLLALQRVDGQVVGTAVHTDDLASAVTHLLRTYDDESHINVGTGTDVTITELAELVAKAVGYSGDIIWDTSKPDGTPRKLLDISKLKALGWSPQVDLADGITDTYEWFRENQQALRA